MRDQPTKQAAINSKGESMGNSNAKLTAVAKTAVVCPDGKEQSFNGFTENRIEDSTLYGRLRLKLRFMIWIMRWLTTSAINPSKGSRNSMIDKSNTMELKVAPPMFVTAFIARSSAGVW